MLKILRILIYQYFDVIVNEQLSLWNLAFVICDNQVQISSFILKKRYFDVITLFT